MATEQETSAADILYHRWWSAMVGSDVAEAESFDEVLRSEMALLLQTFPPATLIGAAGEGPVHHLQRIHLLRSAETPALPGLAFTDNIYGYIERRNAARNTALGQQHNLAADPPNLPSIEIFFREFVSQLNYGTEPEINQAWNQLHEEVQGFPEDELPTVDLGESVFHYTYRAAHSLQSADSTDVALSPVLSSDSVRDFILRRGLTRPVEPLDVSSAIYYPAYALMRMRDLIISLEVDYESQINRTLYLYNQAVGANYNIVSAWQSIVINTLSRLVCDIPTTTSIQGYVIQRVATATAVNGTDAGDDDDDDDDDDDNNDEHEEQNDIATVDEINHAHDLVNALTRALNAGSFESIDECVGRGSDFIDGCGNFIRTRDLGETMLHHVFYALNNFVRGEGRTPALLDYDIQTGVSLETYVEQHRRYRDSHILLDIIILHPVLHRTVTAALSNLIVSMDRRRPQSIEDSLNSVLILVPNLSEPSLYGVWDFLMRDHSFEYSTDILAPAPNVSESSWNYADRRDRERAREAAIAPGREQTITGRIREAVNSRVAVNSASVSDPLQKLFVFDIPSSDKDEILQVGILFTQTSSDPHKVVREEKLGTLVLEAKFRNALRKCLHMKPIRRIYEANNGKVMWTDLPTLSNIPEFNRQCAIEGLYVYGIRTVKNFTVTDPELFVGEPLGPPFKVSPMAIPYGGRSLVMVDASFGSLTGGEFSDRY